MSTQKNSSPRGNKNTLDERRGLLDEYFKTP
jgi:hypothetical protein